MLVWQKRKIKLREGEMTYPKSQSKLVEELKMEPSTLPP